MGLPDDQLRNLLLEDEIIDEETLNQTAEFATLQKINLYEALIQKDLVSDENLGKLIADFYKLPFIKLSKIAIKEEVLKIVPQRVAERDKVIAFRVAKGILQLAVNDPYDQELIGMIGYKFGGEIEIYYATERDIQDSLRLYKKDLNAVLGSLLTEISESKKDVPVTEIVNLLLEAAYEQKASDIHIEPSDEESLVRYRIDGVLSDIVRLPRSLHEQIVTRIKVASRLRTDEHLAAQDGKMQIKLTQEEVDIRVSIVPIVDGEKIVMRLLTSHFRQFSLNDLGMGEADLEKVKNGFNKPYGMVLSTGPTGSGKSTSIYAILKILNSREKNIATIEDPVEYDIQGINQIQVNAKTNLTFAEGLRSILRQDPDIIYVGEIRDEDTASIAINSATTGHLVFSTLHTNDAATSFVRLIDMGVEPFLVASTVNTVIAQRLVRKICEKCKVSETMALEELEKHISKELIKKHFGEGDEIRMYRGKGCPVCHMTGFTGRVGIFEVLDVNQEIQALVTSKAASEEISKKAIELGMSTMLEDGLDKVQQGITSLEEVMKATLME